MKTQGVLLFLFSTLIVICFNNCGQFLEQPKLSGSNSLMSVNQYPWPNSTTSLENSDLMATEVLFNDLDGDTYQEALFISVPQIQSAALSQEVVVRIVNSANFEELINIPSLKTNPHLGLKMLLLDVERNDSSLELVYVSHDLNRIIAVSLSPESLGTEKLNLALPSMINPEVDRSLSSKPLGWDIIIVAGDNHIFITPEGMTRVESALAPIDGGWTPWSDWTSCSKTCGDGTSLRMRLCANPVPRNGGLACSGNGYEERSCRLRACAVTDCNANEIHDPVTNNCLPDPNASQQTTTGSSGGTGGLTGGGGGTTGGGTGITGGTGGSTGFGPQSCTNGKVWDPFMFGCFTPYPISDIFLRYDERIYRSSDEGGPQVIMHRYRISLSHSRAIGLSHPVTAGEYCRLRGYDGAISHTTAKINVGPANRNAFVLCNIGTNGLYFGRGGCMIGNYSISFTYRNIVHAVNEEMTYLKSVVCRKGAAATTNSMTTTNSVQ